VINSAAQLASLATTIASGLIASGAARAGYGLPSVQTDIAQASVELAARILALAEVKAGDMSDAEYYAAHDCPTCDPVDHCPHGGK
jgi:hypothetical protein